MVLFTYLSRRRITRYQVFLQYFSFVSTLTINSCNFKFEYKTQFGCKNFKSLNIIKAIKELYKNHLLLSLLNSNLISYFPNI